MRLPRLPRGTGVGLDDHSSRVTARTVELCSVPGDVEEVVPLTAQSCKQESFTDHQPA